MTSVMNSHPLPILLQLENAETSLVSREIRTWPNPNLIICPNLKHVTCPTTTYAYGRHYSDAWHLADKCFSACTLAD